MLFAILVFWYALVATALNVTNPKNDQVVDISKEFTIRWTTGSSDPAQVSIDIVNATKDEQYVLVNVVRGANTSAGQYNIYWPSAVPSTNASYQLIFLDYATGGFAGSSNTFNLTLPVGEQRNSSVGNAPQGPSQSATATATATPKTSSQGLSTSAIVAAALVPSLVVITLIAGGIFFFLRRRHRAQNYLSTDHEKPELAGISKPRRNSVSKFPVEIASDHIRWELPSTPPRDPVELPAEVPTSELDSTTERDRKFASGATNMTTETSETATETATATSPALSPFITSDGRFSLTSPVSPPAPRRDDATTSGRSRFEEALYDLVSDELRRPE